MQRNVDATDLPNPACSCGLPAGCPHDNLCIAAYKTFESIVIFDDKEFQHITKTGNYTGELLQKLTNDYDYRSGEVLNQFAAIAENDKVAKALFLLIRKLPLQQQPVSASSICEARQKMPETIFTLINQKLLSIREESEPLQLMSIL